MQEEIIIPYKSDIPFIDSLNFHIDKIQEMLFSYHYSKRERVYDVEIVEKTIYKTDDSQGWFTVNYMIGLFNACADLDYNTSEKMKIEFDIDLKSNTVLLKGEDIPEQEQHEI